MINIQYGVMLKGNVKSGNGVDLSGSIICGKSAPMPDYSGPYTITPTESTQTLNTKDKTICILKDNLGDCSNNGLSARYDRLQMISESEMLDFVGNTENVVVRIDRLLFGKIMPVLVPFELYRDYKTHRLPVMFGGNFAYTSDSRFNWDYPLPIHDRVESWEEYESYSN